MAVVYLQWVVVLCRPSPFPPDCPALHPKLVGVHPAPSGQGATRLRLRLRVREAQKRAPHRLPHPTYIGVHDTERGCDLLRRLA